ncbi:glycosyltransferase family 2 protein [Breznakia sp. OttesenSCG-928-G09]|nr:glycosyltransferase family 2 protein [Breznakia sp. OttesenSCG-928-G09]
MSTISVIIPCYNVEKMVLKCIDSIKNQSFSDFEVLLVDDGSKDNTADVINEAISNDPRFHYFYKENGGQADARNYGIKKANSDYLTFVDSDDYIHRDYLKELIDSLNDKTLVSACYFERIYDDKTNINKFDQTDVLLSKYPAVWGKIIKHSLIKEYNLSFPKGLWYEDLGFFTMLMAHVDEVNVVDKSLYYYIQHNSSTMHTFDNRIFDMYKILGIVESYYKQQGVFNKYESRLEYINVYHVLVGTIFRASFMESFDKNSISDIYAYVNKKYPMWDKNEYIATQMSLFYRTYLFFLKRGWFGMVSFILKKFNSKARL